MTTTYRKINVTADRLSFAPGTLLGLATNITDKYPGYFKKIARGEFEVTTRVEFMKGDVIWVDEKSLPKVSEGLFRQVSMPKAYQDYIAPFVPKIERIVPKVDTYATARENMR